MTIDHRAELNSVIYALFRAPSLDREVAGSMAEAMMAREYFVDGPEAYSRAIAQALAQPDPVTADIEPPYDDPRSEPFSSSSTRNLKSTSLGHDATGERRTPPTTPPDCRTARRAKNPRCP